MDIEKKAVNTIENVISSCDYLESQITSNDKGVSWDGCINVYKKKGDVHEKDALFKSVRVQVKGHKASRVYDKSIRYPVQIADLRNYLTEGGTVFFVVYINKERNEHQIYFKPFLPVDIKPILKKYGKQKTRVVEFHPFPSDKDEISELLINIAANIKKQLPFIEADEIITLEELGKSGIPTNVTYSYATVSNYVGSTTDVFFDYKQYIYAKNDSGIEIPVGNCKFDYRESTIYSPVHVEGERFYDNYTLRKTKDETIYIFGKAVTLRVKKCDKSSIKMEFCFSGNLNERLKDVGFVYAFLTKKRIEIGDVVIVNPSVDNTDETIDLKRLFEYLNCLRDVKQMLNQISFNGEFEYDKVSPEDAKWLRVLVDYFVLKKPVKFVSDGVGLANIQIAGYDFKFFVNRLTVENEDVYSIISLDAFRWKIEKKDRDGNLYQVSLYSLLTKEDLLTCVNIDCDALLKQTKQVPMSEYFAWELNRLLLDIISAWDETGDARADLSDAAYNLAVWIRNEVDFIPKEISTLNFYQIVKRMRALNAAEYAELSQLLDISELTPDCRMAAHLLLDEHHSARRCFCKLTTEQQDAYKRMPIFRFWKEDF